MRFCLKKPVDSQSEHPNPSLTTQELLAIKKFAGFLLDNTADFPGSRQLGALLQKRGAEFGLDAPKGRFPSATTITDNDSVTGDEKITEENLIESDKFSLPASALEEEIPYDPSKPEDVRSTFDDELTIVTSVRSRTHHDHALERTTSACTPSPATPDFFEDRAYMNCVIGGTNAPPVTINHHSYLEQGYPSTNFRTMAFSGATITGGAIINSHSFNGNTNSHIASRSDIHDGRFNGYSNIHWQV